MIRYKRQNELQNAVHLAHGQKLLVTVFSVIVVDFTETYIIV